jgi:hypothetical protein
VKKQNHFDEKIIIAYLILYPLLAFLHSFSLVKVHHFMFKKNYSNNVFLFRIGIIGLIITIIVSFSIFGIYRSLNLLLFEVSKEDVYKLIIGVVLFPIIHSAKTYFDYLIVKELTPFHMIFPEIIFSFVKELINFFYLLAKPEITTSNEQKIYSCIFAFGYCFTFIGLSMYLELIELNFCGLNKNTKSSISRRSENDFESNSKELVENAIDLGDYILNLN